MFNLFALRSAVSNLRASLKDPVSAFVSMRRGLVSWLLSMQVRFFETKDKFKDLLTTNIELGLYHFYNLNFSEAAFRFNLVLLMKPDLPALHYHKGRCAFYQGRIDEAKKALNKALVLQPGFTPALFYLQKILSQSKIKGIPPEVTHEYFDHVARSYVQNQIINARYTGQNFLLRIVIDYFSNSSPQIRYLDLGCGTGVCGQFLRLKNVASSLVGVDISSDMLRVAAHCVVDGVKVYGELIQSDLSEFATEERYDLVSMLDVCDYIGDFEWLLHKAKLWLLPRGIIVGAVRQSTGQGSQLVDLCLHDEQGCNFFSFSKSYLEGVFERCGLKALFLESHHLYNGVSYWCWVVR